MYQSWPSLTRGSSLVDHKDSFFLSSLLLLLFLEHGRRLRISFPSLVARSSSSSSGKPRLTIICYRRPHSTRFACLQTRTEAQLRRQCSEREGHGKWNQMRNEAKGKKRERGEHKKNVAGQRHRLFLSPALLSSLESCCCCRSSRRRRTSAAGKAATADPTPDQHFSLSSPPLSLSRQQDNSCAHKRGRERERVCMSPEPNSSGSSAHAHMQAGSEAGLRDRAPHSLPLGPFLPRSLARHSKATAATAAAGRAPLFRCASLAGLSFFVKRRLYASRCYTRHPPSSSLLSPSLLLPWSRDPRRDPCLALLSPAFLLLSLSSALLPPPQTEREREKWTRDEGRRLDCRRSLLIRR